MPHSPRLYFHNMVCPYREGRAHVMYDQIHCPSNLLCHTAQECASKHPWAARYNTWLLIKLTLKGVVFPSLFCSASQHGMCPYREGSANSDMGSRASLRDDDITQAEVIVESARQAVGELMRKIEQVKHASAPNTQLSLLGYAVVCARPLASIHRTAESAYKCIFARHTVDLFEQNISNKS